MLVADALDVVLAETVVQHRRALQGFHRNDQRIVLFLQVVSRPQRPRRPRRGDEGAQPQGGLTGLERLKEPPQRTPRHQVVNQVIPEFGELVEDDVLRIAPEFVALVVDLLDVALRPGRADDVLRIGHPPFQPGEALPAHPLGQHGDAAAAHDPGDGYPAAGVVAGRGPDRPVRGRVELPGDDPRGQAPVRRQHLVRPDHREAITQRDDDAGVYTGERLRQDDVLGQRDRLSPPGAVAPVDPEEVERVRRVRLDAGQRRADLHRNLRGIRQFGEGGQHDLRLAEPLHGMRVDLLIDDVSFPPQPAHPSSPYGAGSTANRSRCRNCPVPGWPRNRSPSTICRPRSHTPAGAPRTVIPSNRL